MKALDKVLDETTVKYFIGDKFHFIEAKENFLYEDKKRTDKSRTLVAFAAIWNLSKSK